jgi:hypothetical protein
MGDSHSGQSSASFLLEKSSTTSRSDDLPFESSKKQRVQITCSPQPEDTAQPHGPPQLARNSGRHGTLLPSAFQQLRWDLLLCFGMIPLSILLFLYVYAALVSDNPPLGPLLFSPSRTLLVITILSQGLAILFRMLFNSVFEALRWHFVSRKKGVSATTFLGLSPATSSLGVLKLLYLTKICNHTWWCIQRYSNVHSMLNSQACVALALHSRWCYS